MTDARELLQSVVDALPQPMVVIGDDERIHHVNGPALRLVGNNAVGRHFITALRQPSLLDTVEATLRDHAPRQTSFLTREDGQDVTYAIRCAAIHRGDRHGVLLSFEDVTDVEAASQMRRDFVANVSHELKTPLTALLGFIETILHGPAREDAAARDRFLGIMEAEAERMNRLVGDLLSLNRVEATERMRPTSRIDLAVLLTSVVKSLSGIAGDAGLEIRADVPEPPVSVPGDADQLRQVLTNLIENAIKYGAEGKRIDVRLTPPAYHPRMRCDAVELVVRDFGPGFDPVHIPRLTERFYRVDSHRSRQMGGTVGAGDRQTHHRPASRPHPDRIRAGAGRGLPGASARLTLRDVTAWRISGCHNRRTSRFWPRGCSAAPWLMVLCKPDSHQTHADFLLSNIR